MGRHHLVAEAYASDLGTFSAKFNLPSNPKGENRLFAIGHVTYLLAEAGFTVMEKVSLAPNEGYVGCGINISGNGFTPNSEIKIDFGRQENLPYKTPRNLQASCHRLYYIPFSNSLCKSH